MSTKRKYTRKKEQVPQGTVIQVKSENLIAAMILAGYILLITVILFGLQ